MIKYFFLFSFVLYIFSTENCMGQWVQCNGMHESDVRSLVTLENNIFAGTVDSGVYLSSDNGANWTKTTLNNNTVWALAVLGNNIFAGTDGNGIYLSTNNGTSWVQTSLNNKAISSLVILGTNIFAGTMFNGIYLSTNNGVSWTQTSLNNRLILSLVKLGSNIFAGTSGYGVYISTNNGTSWAQTTLNKDIWSFTTSGSNIFAGTYYEGIYLSSNNGTNWTQIGLNNKTVYSLTAMGNDIFAGTYESGIYYSNNNGANWIEKNQGLSGSLIVKALLIANNYILAGNSGQSIWRRQYTEIIGVQKISTEAPSRFSLFQNYPNPFNPTTNIKYQIANNQFVTLKIFDILGKEILTLVNEKQKAGTYEVTFDGNNLPSGIYFYQLKSDNFTETKKLILLK